MAYRAFSTLAAELCLLAALHPLAAPAAAQQIFYDSKRDKQAQDAAAAAKDVVSGGVFDRMLSNAGRQSEAEQSMALEWQGVLGPYAFDDVDVWDAGDAPETDRLAMRGASAASACVQKSVFTRINRLKCRSVRCRMEGLRRQLEIDTAADAGDAQAAQRLTAIESEVKALKATIEQLTKSQNAAADQYLKPFLDQLENGDKLLGYAKQINEQTSLLGKTQALGEIQTTVTELKKWAGIVQQIWVGYQAIQQSPRNLMPLHEQLDLDLLLIEQERLARQGLIYARLRLDAGDVLTKLDDAQEMFCGNQPLGQCAQLQSKESIAATLKRLAEAKDREQLNTLLRGLFDLSSAFVQGPISVQLCSTREGAANRHAAIRKAAVSAKASEKAVEEATQRLSLYYKSGIKPSELASLIFSVAGGIAAPVAAAK